MRHLRSDYDPIQDPRGLIPDDEPVFLLRGQDAATPAAIRAWADSALDLGSDREMVAEVRRWADAIDAWQARHGAQPPDVPAGAIREAAL